MQQRIVSIFGVVVLSMISVGGTVPVATAQTGSGYLRDDDPKNWPMYNRSFDGSRSSPLKEIAKEDVKNLQVAWIYQPGAILLGLLETALGCRRWSLFHFVAEPGFRAQSSDG
jgi:glucose dehydrogenase